ncbi:MAG: hypothetical protein PVG03_15715, partial [Desulfarculaceae bacterium]
RKEARHRLGLDPIWGLAANKLVAKAATRVVKPLGECLVPAGGEEAFLKPLPLHMLPGLEREDLLILRDYNLARVQEALAWGAEHWTLLFGQRGTAIHRLLRGKDDSPVLPLDAKPPVVRFDHEFEDDTNDAPQVQRALHGLAERAGQRLRGLGRAARRVALVLDYSDGARIARQRSHPQGTANDFLIFALARAALASAWTRQVRLRHLRLICDHLVFPTAQLELPLAPDAEQARRRKEESLLSALDRIRQRHGAGLVRLGRSLTA